MKKPTSVEEYIEINPHFSEEITILRNIINSTALEETIKWNMPTYCIKGKNVLGLAAFKNHFCIWFHQGVFLKDELRLLKNAQEQKTKAMRQMRFETKNDINEAAVLTYVKEAIENQHLGKELQPQRTNKTVAIPKELKEILDTNTDFKTAFNTLTPSKQRDYSDYISEAKRDVTKQKRLEKIIPLVLNGVGLNDKYRTC
ncbi:YdeI/OmpD-associated family protein [Winogradskyella bathintestinalis]|uniref:YdeI/OmpD-associated family protein n=1 Tax=Winogradskyella bathintestinalis TaxID=3035208 RepID=A0ABT7ZXI0_9FLAO|nr:DUF1801 domain-containing protein [Winogradskyella bathintestinalis]MDN3493646.1 YdeI/OmpD-associated family protein [Winogradskyella bathintestinalis]